MEFDEFERRAHELFESIPPELRGGVEYLVVSADAVAHPELPEVYTLGECSTGELDLDAGPEGFRSGVHLYHGSFAKVAGLDPEFDWEGELKETVLHEIRHHRESAAGEDALEDFDYAADENFKRREGEPFDPLFYRAGEPGEEEETWEVDGDLFVERMVDADAFEAMEEVVADVAGRRVSLPRPERLGDVSFLYLEGFGDGRGETAVVLVRRRGAWESFRSLFRSAAPEVLEWTVEADDWWVEEEAGGARDSGAPLA